MIPKFRAWDKKCNEMFKDTFAVTESGQVVVVEQKSVFNSPDYIFTDDLILMQSTGLKDKNGKEIFEDDVVKLIDEYGGSGMSKVISQEGSLGMVIEEVFVPFATISILSTVDYTLEVIGNIYENPELVEENNE